MNGIKKAAGIVAVAAIVLSGSIGTAEAGSRHGLNKHDIAKVAKAADVYPWSVSVTSCATGVQSTLKYKIEFNAMTAFTGNVTAQLTQGTYSRVAFDSVNPQFEVTSFINCA